MDSVHFLNLEYLVTRTYDFVRGIQFDPTVIPDWVAGFTHIILILGMLLSLILLILVVYAQIRMVQVEHEGFHALEEEEHEAHAHAHGPEGETHTSTRWDDIVALSTSANESDWRRAILEADIMLGDVLNERGFEGASVGDQLKMANPFQMKTLDVAWEAHKMRNQVAHAGEALQLTERDVRATIDQYKRVFEEFGKI
jgi:hypothetical protein